MLILLADDERLIRLGLQSMLEELFPGKHTYVHARNGNEVIHAVKEKAPDIAFLDVKMPLMNGLEALRVCRELSASTIWIILSGYADFEYARQALALSAFDYLLKPVEIDTLQTLFDRISISQEQQKRNNNSLFAHDVIRSFTMADQLSTAETEFLPADSSDYILYQFYIDFLEQDMQEKIKQTLCDNLEEFCAKTDTIVNYCIFFNTDGNLCLICDVPDASRLTHFIILQSELLGSKAFSVFWGNARTIRQIYSISRRIARIADIRLVYDCSSMPVFIKDIEALPALTQRLTFARDLTTLLNQFIQQNKSGFRQSISLLKATACHEQNFALVDTSVLQNYLSAILGLTVSIQTYGNLIDLLESCEATLSSNIIGPTITDIKKIREYVYRNYSQDVSMSRISELFNLSPAYLSRLFHEKTGQKYIDFVTQVRMEAAKKMIRQNSSASVKQIAEAVGYSSVRHFSKTFQKYTGVLPSVFR